MRIMGVKYWHRVDRNDGPVFLVVVFVAVTLRPMTSAEK